MAKSSFGFLVVGWLYHRDFFYQIHDSCHFFDNHQRVLHFLELFEKRRLALLSFVELVFLDALLLDDNQVVAWNLRGLLIKHQSAEQEVFEVEAVLLGLLAVMRGLWVFNRQL
jgi:hypothetical protein